MQSINTPLLRLSSHLVMICTVCVRSSWKDSVVLNLYFYRGSNCHPGISWFGYKIDNHNSLLVNASICVHNLEDYWGYLHQCGKDKVWINEHLQRLWAFHIMAVKDCRRKWSLHIFAVNQNVKTCFCVLKSTL